MHRIRPRSRRCFLSIAGALLVGGCAWAPRRPSPFPRPDDPKRPPPGPISPEDLEKLDAQIIESHNKIRIEHKLRKFSASRKLTAAAQSHAEDMAARRKMSHTGGDGSSSSERVRARGYRYFRTGENVAAGYFTVDRVMKGWMDSPGHRRNILGAYSEIGVGCAVGEDGKRYWCVTFGLPASR